MTKGNIYTCDYKSHAIGIKITFNPISIGLTFVDKSYHQILIRDHRYKNVISIPFIGL